MVGREFPPINETHIVPFRDDELDFSPIEPIWPLKAGYRMVFMWATFKMVDEPQPVAAIGTQAEWCPFHRTMEVVIQLSSVGDAEDPDFF